MTKDGFYLCEICNLRFQPMHKHELCPRCDKVAAIARAEKAEAELHTLRVTLDGLKVALAEMNAIALDQ